jgi:hypothetical protein
VVVSLSLVRIRVSRPSSSICNAATCAPTAFSNRMNRHGPPFGACSILTAVFSSMCAANVSVFVMYESAAYFHAFAPFQPGSTTVTVPVFTSMSMSAADTAAPTVPGTSGTLR